MDGPVVPSEPWLCNTQALLTLFKTRQMEKKVPRRVAFSAAGMFIVRSPTGETTP
jgi:hypothetical protein